jgi:serine/threonine-protein kinase
MGVVWRALDTKTGSPVAIKLMKDISDPVAVDLFTKEWKALAEMSHPNIVEVRDVDVIEENRQKKPLFVMPLLRGATLADLIADASARLTLARIVEITTQVCKGLQAAHQRGLVHRDLKPSNIFVMEDDTAKIIDFGVVHLAGSKSITGQKGTFQYMSPEQALLKEITPASDLFSLGVILYEALTLRKPFARNTADETMEAVIKYIPPPVSEINPSISQSVSRVVHKCLAKQPIHRFSSARELSETLQKAFRNEPIFDSAKIEPRIERAKAAFKSGDEPFASEILAELEAEGNLDPRITVLRTQIDMAVKQKKIRQLLESARARVEQDEIPLALDKLREVLELDPQNSEALGMREAVEKQRSQTQIAKWFELAETHLQNRDFSAARHAAKEVLAIRRADPRALDLLEKIESTEADAKRIREQKEQLYGSAMRAYQNGEIDTALNKLERLFSVARANPSAAIPERDAVYQSFYKEVRSESDTIHRALEDAQRQFSDQNFAGAMAVCSELLSKYPNDGTFQALKIRIEDAERQQLSAYIAEISKRLESDPDLDRRVNVLREASERYPNEVQFAQQLKLIRERRDLVNSIVAKARQYEERGQLTEAINQWDILRNIHPQYPGIAFELEQCKKKRDRQTREEEHARLVEEIDGLMEGRAFAKAIEYANSALQEFPNDPELSGLRTLAEQGLERSKESRRLFDEGQRALTEKDLTRATELLRSSLSLDSRSGAVRDTLVNVLAERARLLVDENWREAEPLYQEASELDSGHTAVRALRSMISEAKRQAFVGQVLTECRGLVAAGNQKEAAQRIHSARQEYPNDPRLEQYESTLQKEVNEIKRREERGRDRAVLVEDRRVLERNPDRVAMRGLLERSYAIRSKHPDDRDIAQTVAEIEVAVKGAARVEDLSELLTVETARTGTDGFGVAAAKAYEKSAPDIGKGRPRGPDKATDARTKLFPVEKLPLKTKPSPFAGSQRLVRSLAVAAVTLVRPQGKWSVGRLGTAGGLFVAVLVIIYVIGRPGKATPEKPPQAPPVSVAQITLELDPPDSVVTSDSKAIAGGSVAAGTVIEVKHLGYQTSKPIQVQQASDGKIALQPEPVHLSVQTSDKAGKVELDGTALGTIADGVMEEHDLVPDGKSHSLKITTQGAPVVINFQMLPGAQPKLDPVVAKDLFVLTSLGNRAKLYGGNLLRNVRLGDVPVAVSPQGVDLSLAAENHDLKLGEGADQSSLSIDLSNAPILAVHSIAISPQIRITTNVETAALDVDGVRVRRQKDGWLVTRPPGTYKFVVSAPGYVTQEFPVTLAPRQVAAARPVNLEKPKAKKTGLVIAQGTPGAEVFLDQQRIGELDNRGELQVQDALTPGHHDLVFRKEEFEPRSYGFTADPFSDFHVPDMRQSPWPILSVQPTPNTAAVKYHAVGDSKMQDAKSGESLHLPPGEYEILAEAPGYQSLKQTIKLAAGENRSLSAPLVVIANYEYQDITQIVTDGAWVKSVNPGKFVYLKSGFLRVNLIFAKPGKNLFWKKKVVWVVEPAAGSGLLEYEFDGQKLSRKVVVGDDISDHVDQKVDANAPNQSYSIHLRVEGNHALVTNDKHEVLDDYTWNGHDFSNGRIGVRTDSQFLVRRDNQ